MSVHVEAAGQDPAGAAATITSAATITPHRSRLRTLTTAMRPGQWVKNALVVAAPAAAGTLLSGSVFVPVVLAVAAMCAAASSTYLLNDVGDRERDRAHPTKCRRPIASGALSAPRAVAASAGLIVLSLMTAWLAGPGVAAVVTAYLVVTVSYSRSLKHVPFLELGIVASGFVLRVLVGAVATATAVSIPFLVVVGAGSMFLATGKRLSELISLGPAAAGHRPVLGHYRRITLERIVGTSLVIAVGGYTLWAIGTDAGGSAEPWLMLSVVAIAVAALHLTRRVLRGDAGDPTALVLHDRLLRMTGGTAAALVFVGLYLV